MNETSGDDTAHEGDHLGDTVSDHDHDAASSVDDTDLEAAERALADARARLLDVPAEVVVTNHVMGLYELGAIHLSADPPDLVSASLAIDAVAALVDGLGDRLGDDAGTMREALTNIRMAFVQIKHQTGQSAPADDQPADDQPASDPAGGDPATDG